MATLPGKVSDAVKRLNPHLFSVGGLQASDTQHHSGNASRSQDGRKDKGQSSLGRSSGPYLRITLVVCKRTSRKADGDNLSAGLKHLRDAIASSLGYDDAESEIQWEYDQIETKGPAGVIVRIKPL